MAKRAMGWMAALMLVLLLIWAAGHVFIQPISPDQETPREHVQDACWACHFVTSSADTVEID
ncbi:MAG: hypothetical protein PF636_08015 [Actinomycetota bacterium]|jgi:hypothetical protein|nr:hypothetical protein [Actinomycetota bacterium]